VSPNAKVRSKSWRVGGHQSPDHFRGRTAPGLCTQNLEIKYKKPNAQKTQQIFLSTDLWGARSYAYEDGSDSEPDPT
jgi:hypothetical protein